MKKSVTVWLVGGLIATSALGMDLYTVGSAAQKNAAPQPPQMMQENMDSSEMVKHCQEMMSNPEMQKNMQEMMNNPDMQKTMQDAMKSSRMPMNGDDKGNMDASEHEAHHKVKQS